MGTHQKAPTVSERAQALGLAYKGIPYGLINEWFDGALLKTDPRPTNAVLEGLAEEFQKTFIAANNATWKEAAAQTGEPVPEHQLTYFVLAEWERDNIMLVEQTAKRTLVACLDYQRRYGGHVWPNGDDDFTLTELIETLQKVAYFALPEPGDPKRGRPGVAWRDAARHLCRLIEKSLKEAGYEGALSRTNPETAPVRIAANAISWAYGKEITPDTVVTALRRRDRRKTRKRTGIRFPDIAVH